MIWAVASFGICFFARDLQRWHGGPSMAYALAGQGLLIVFLLLAVANAFLFRREDLHEDAPGDGG